ncbi:hypothetical protein MPRM_14570 [Mycobacterium parmense]|uniref:DUF732 domain-containing protein n=2 Tax=Mycobacterium parmense TaxID=185642 RepID=A0A7I7YQM0_9MYCO|nr:hypothetical protein MPRM_14570 [Mycobacterium parmense]
MLAGVTVAIGTAASAQADVDGKDQAFLTTLRQAGVTYMNPERAVAAGKSVCDLVDGGMTGAEIVKNLQEKNPGFEGDGAAKFAAIAAQAYCPQALTAQDAGAASKSDNS